MRATSLLLFDTFESKVVQKMNLNLYNQMIILALFCTVFTTRVAKSITN
jgi:hypothetical protein